MSKKRSKELELIVRDIDARKNGADKKKFHVKDLNPVTPLTQHQKETFHAYNSNLNLFLYGTAGTGKTFIGMYLALRDVLDESTPFHKLIIIRSSVPTREIGYLPGDEKEKMEVYEAPYMNICNYLFSYNKSYQNLKSGGYVEFMSTSYLRGLTFDNAVILVDEVQNLSFHECDSIMTRIGQNTKIVFCGDGSQTDFTRSRDSEGFQRFLNIIKNIKEFGVVQFSIDDIVRSGIVRSYLIEKERQQ